ncbi:hypothetical protein UPYG_G00095490 [Umbra pygmaea]|uniref:Uncharacterized protein n=1 Tax=Umbra pygmaea TaxID=75934 RepID=A0ABD0XPJ6_UMBPY
MSDASHTSMVTVGVGQASRVDSVSRCSGNLHTREAPPGKQASSRRCGRLMHQSTLTLGSPLACEGSYTTTHTESFRGRAADGQPLIFHLRVPDYTSQHATQLKLNDRWTTKSQTHSRDVYAPKEVIPYNVLHSLGLNNRSRNRDGVAMREVTNPHEPTPYLTTYCSEHVGLSPAPSRCTGRPTIWHQHDILTGEVKSPAGPGKARRPSLERVLWATRRWENDCCSLQLN